MTFTTSMMDALAARKQLERESLDPRLNVHFTNLEGKPDVFSFADLARAERFREQLRHDGREVFDGRTMAEFWSLNDEGKR
jgi:hypothetical protein